MSAFGIVTALSALLSLMAVVGSYDYQDAVEQQSQYCEMVREWKASNGERGWPDYNRNFKEVCK